MIFESFSVFISKIMCFSAFLQDSSQFPTPLSKAEEAEYVQKYIDGDEESGQILVERNLRLVAHVIKKFQNCGEADDLISIGTIGLIKAVRSFKPDKNVMLSTYAARCIENEVLMMLRANKKHLNTSSFEDILASDKDGNEMTYLDTLASPDKDIYDVIETKVLSEDVLKVMKCKLSPREYKVIVMRFGLDGYFPHAQREVAKKLGISRSYISRLEMKALDTIKAEMQYSIEQ